MSDTAEGELLEEQRGAIRIVTINRPQARNAMNAAVIGGIGRAMTDADADPDVHAVVLTATGTQAFCSGMDLREFAAEAGAPAVSAVAAATEPPGSSDGCARGSPSRWCARRRGRPSPAAWSC